MASDVGLLLCQQYLSSGRRELYGFLGHDDFVALYTPKKETNVDGAQYTSA